MTTVPQNSRYKDTFAYRDGTNDVMGPFQLPDEFGAVESTWPVHVVASNEVGFFDLIAVTYYGPGSEPLWWVICLMNGIIDPDTDVVPGQRIFIPPRDVVARFVARRPRV